MDYMKDPYVRISSRVGTAEGFLATSDRNVVTLN